MSFYKKLFFVSIFSLLSSQFIFSQTTDPKTMSSEKSKLEIKKNAASLTLGFLGTGLQFERAISEKSAIGAEFQFGTSIGYEYSGTLFWEPIIKEVLTDYYFYGISYSTYKTSVFDGVYGKFGLEYLSASRQLKPFGDAQNAISPYATVGYKWNFNPILLGVQAGFGYAFPTSKNVKSFTYLTLRVDAGFNF